MISRRKRTGAFTIVELLLASAITLGIVVLLGVIFGSITRTASRANHRTDAFRDARAALQTIERDLSNLIHASPAAYFTATIATTIYDDGNTAPQKNHQLYALCALKNQPAGNPTPVAGDMCAIGYYCRWQTNAGGQQGRYVLKRHFRDSDATFKAFQANGAGNYMQAKTLYLPAAGDDILASYVWNLQITLYKADGTIDATYPNSTDTFTVTDSGGSSAALPPAIEISFKAISPEAAVTLMSVSSSQRDWMDPTTSNYKHYIAPNAYEFRTRIKF